jgi:hypothetical protein
MKRRWDDDVVFKNQARGTEERGKKKEFINDMLRSDFHKKFMVSSDHSSECVPILTFLNSLDMSGKVFGHLTNLQLRLGVCMILGVLVGFGVQVILCITVVYTPEFEGVGRPVTKLTLISIDQSISALGTICSGFLSTKCPTRSKYTK